jgi:hypothetical protein
MGWNIDIVAIGNPEGLFLPDYVPDVLVGHADMIGFEDATSGARFSPPQLCATRLDAWGIVTDVPCKLRAFPGYLAEISIGRTVHVIHVGMAPMLLTHSNGREVQALHGLDACRAHLLTRPHTCADVNDGELVAWGIADQIVDQRLIDALWNKPFAVFSLDGA